MRGAHGTRLLQVHRLVTAAFIGPCPADMEVNHIDGDKSNNHTSNLEFCTASENLKHRNRLRSILSATTREYDSHDLPREIWAGVDV
jgi:hypothetical protein